jgi:hypothetical protein
MASVTNVDGSNPGPNIVSAPENTQAPTGNVWKLASFTVAFTAATISNASNSEQTLTVTGLLTTDVVVVNAPAAANPGVGIAGARVSAAGVLAINFVNASAATTVGPAGNYLVSVIRVQPNWTQPTTGSSIDF